MTNLARHNSHASVVWWSQVNRWVNPNQILQIHKLPARWTVSKVRDVVRSITEKCIVQPDQEYRMVGVKWYGEGVFHRESVKGESISAKFLTPVVPGAFIYNRLFAWKASFAVVPESFSDHYVSSEFPQFITDETRLLPHFLYLWFVNDRVIRSVTASSIGSAAVSRNRFKEEQFLEFPIPLPPVSIQKVITRYWQKAHEGIDHAKEAISRPVKELNERLYRLYHAICKQDVMGTKSFVLDFKDLKRWDVKSGRSSTFRIHSPSFRPMGDFIEDATELARPFEEPEKEWPIYGVNNQEGVFFNTYQKGCNFNAPYKRIREDWFFHNPTRCNVGSLGIVPDVPEDAITSPEYQVWRLRENNSERLLPGYVALLIQTPFFLELVQFNRVGAVKQRMYYENLCEIRIPSLPESEQRKYSEERAKALGEIQEARTNFEQVKKEIEEMILGIRPVK